MVDKDLEKIRAQNAKDKQEFDKKVRELIEYHIEHLGEENGSEFIMDILALDIEYMHCLGGGNADVELEGVDVDEVDIKDIKIPATSNGYLKEGLAKYVSSAQNVELSQADIITHLMIEYMNDADLVAKLELLGNRICKCSQE